MKIHEWLYVIAIGFIVLGALTVWIASSYFESRTYNRLTGAQTTTWDAMWVELRVQNTTK